MDIQINFSTESLHKFDDLVNVLQKDNGRETKYKMSLNDLLRVLSSSTSGARAESPFLPKNCFKHVKTSRGYEVYVEIPKQRWMINFNGNMFEVGFPRLIFRYDCILRSTEKGNKYSVEIARIVAVKGNERITGDTPLFQFPYSHVESNGKVCMGGNKFEEISCLTELETKHNIFFHSPFSTDWGAKTKLGRDVAILFSSEFNQKDFDDEVLLPMDYSFNKLFALGI
ncbi:hypothetical protein [Alkalihalobacillus sp. BA299]|uniref:hypothetical protein n=1 Tax=Alkalihalobacillus sp. BA299 TaxID=2815938 RepID=UPI001ADBFA47|nr:hypothetical protein [Alkalihalobacillus sp. BA299]